MRWWLSLSVLVIWGAQARADYDLLLFGELICLADAIVIGKITRLEKSTFDVQVAETWAGNALPGESMTVARFQDWACAQRWEKYATGQRVLLFLKVDDDHPNGPWRILGAGNEGESRVIDEDVTPNFVTGEQDGRKRAVKITHLRAAVIDFRVACRMTRKKQPGIDRDENGSLWFERIELVSETDAYVAPSNFHRRFPPGETPRLRTVPFAERSPLHRSLAKWVTEEQERTAKEQK